MHGMQNNYDTHTKERIDGSGGSVVVLSPATPPNETDRESLGAFLCSADIVFLPCAAHV